MNATTMQLQMPWHFVRLMDNNTPPASRWISAPRGVTHFYTSNSAISTLGPNGGLR